MPYYWWPTVNNNTTTYKVVFQLTSEEETEEVNLYRVLIVHENDKGYKVIHNDFYQADSASRAVLMAMAEIDTNKYPVEELSFYGGKMSTIDM